MKYRNTLALCSLLLLSPLLLAEEKPAEDTVVLALASVADMTKGTGQNGLAIRPMIVTRLVIREDSIG